jgi:hypothetical protein
MLDRLTILLTGGPEGFIIDVRVLAEFDLETVGGARRPRNEEARPR